MNPVAVSMTTTIGLVRAGAAHPDPLVGAQMIGAAINAMRPLHPHAEFAIVISDEVARPLLHNAVRVARAYADAMWRGQLERAQALAYQAHEHAVWLAAWNDSFRRNRPTGQCDAAADPPTAKASA